MPIFEPNRRDGTLLLTDDLGLPQDPKLYAEAKCKTCYGRGVFTSTRPMTAEDADKLVGDDMRAQVTREFMFSSAVHPDTYPAIVAKRLAAYARGKTTHGSHACGCAYKRYQKVRAFVEAENAAQPPVRLSGETILVMQPPDMTAVISSVVASQLTQQPVLVVDSDGSVK